MKALPYIIISILLGYILLQKNACTSSETEVVSVDTLYDSVYVHDTIVVTDHKPVYVKGDTVWMDSIQYIPDTSYQGLLGQYTSLGNEYFSRKVYSTKFPIENYGYVIVEDSITANSLVSSKLISNLVIPEKTIIVEKLRAQKSQVFVGGGISLPLGAHIGIMHKDLKDRIASLSVGANNNGLTSSLSYYVKIK